MYPLGLLNTQSPPVRKCILAYSSWRKARRFSPSVNFRADSASGNWVIQFFMTFAPSGVLSSHLAVASTGSAAFMLAIALIIGSKAAWRNSVVVASNHEAALPFLSTVVHVVWPNVCEPFTALPS